MGILNQTVAKLWNAAHGARTMFARRQTQQDREPGRVNFIRIGTTAGVPIDPEQVLKIATVWACVRYLTQNVGSLPWRVKQRQPGGDPKLAEGHPVDWLLNNRPDPNMGSFAFRESLLIGAALRGNGYAEIQTNAAGLAVWLHWLPTWRVKPQFDRDGVLEYKVWQPNAEPVIIPGRFMYHVRGFGEGPVGQSVVEYAAESLGWAKATEIFGSSFFGQGMNPTTAVKVAQGLTPDGREELKKEFRDAYAGVDGDKTIVLDAGMELEKLTFHPNEAQFIETRQHQVEEICRWFGVPPHKVMHLLRSTNNNIEHQSLEVVIDSISPWAKRFEEEGNYKLFGQNRQNFFTEMDFEGLLRGDVKSRTEYYRGMFGVGALNTNEIRRKEGMSGIGPKGDKRFVPANMVTLDTAGQEPPAARPSGPGDGGDQRDPGDDSDDPPARNRMNGRHLPH